MSNGVASSILGLTKLGLPRQRRPKSFVRSHAEIVAARHRARGAARRRRFVEDGLTTKGTPCINHYWKNLTILGLHGREREAMRRALIREKNKQIGLTVRGTIRIRQQWPLEMRDISRPERHRILHNDWLYRNRYSKGLTARGTVPLEKRKTALDLKWTEFRKTIRPVLHVEDAHYHQPGIYD